MIASGEWSVGSECRRRR